MEVVLAGIVVAVTAAAAHFSSPARRALYRIRRLRRVDIGGAREGTPVLIVGRIQEVSGSLEAPLTGRPCAAYDVVVRAGNDPFGPSVLREAMATSFTLRDGTGKALIRMDLGVPLVRIRGVARQRAGTMLSADRAMAALVARHAPRIRPLSLRSPLAFVEHIVDRGDEVAIAGVGGWEADPEPDAHGLGYREAPRRFVVAARTRGLPVPVCVLDDLALVRG